jgi:purine-binding chemotaxis protein CheW
VTSSASEHYGSTRRIADEYLTFFIAGEEYGVTLKRVREVIRYETVTRVPGVPALIRGVTNLRGSVVPVIDLAIKFRLPEIPITSRACIVLVELGVAGTSALMGLITEEVGQVLGLAEGELLPAPSFGTPIRSEFISGMAPVGKKFAVMLDIERLLSPSELLDVASSSPTDDDGPEASAPADDDGADSDVDDWDASDASASPSPAEPAESVDLP